MTLDKIADMVSYMIRIGTSKTTTGNYIFGYDELAEHFGVSISEIKNSIPDIETELLKRDEICFDDQTVWDDCLSLIFYTNYCPYYIEE